MIELKNITRSSKRITCNAYIEDHTEAVGLVFDEDKGDFEPYVLPNGYEWCTSHIAHARRYMETLRGKEFNPHDRTIMWY